MKSKAVKFVSLFSIFSLLLACFAFPVSALSSASEPSSAAAASSDVSAAVDTSSVVPASDVDSVADEAYYLEPGYYKWKETIELPAADYTFNIPIQARCEYSLVDTITVDGSTYSKTLFSDEYSLCNGIVFNSHFGLLYLLPNDDIVQFYIPDYGFSYSDWMDYIIGIDGNFGVYCYDIGAMSSNLRYFYYSGEEPVDKTTYDFITNNTIYIYLVPETVHEYYYCGYFNITFSTPDSSFVYTSPLGSSYPFPSIAIPNLCRSRTSLASEWRNKWAVFTNLKQHLLDYGFPEIEISYAGEGLSENQLLDVGVLGTISYDNSHMPDFDIVSIDFVAPLEAGYLYDSDNPAPDPDPDPGPTYGVLNGWYEYIAHPDWNALFGDTVLNPSITYITDVVGPVQPSEFLGWQDFVCSGVDYIGFTRTNLPGTFLGPVVYQDDEWRFQRYRRVYYDNVTVSIDEYNWFVANTVPFDYNEYMLGYDEGYEEGYSDGYSVGVSINDSAQLVNGFFGNVMSSIGEGLSNITLLQYDLGGTIVTVTLWSIIGTLVVICIVIWILKLIAGG